MTEDLCQAYPDLCQVCPHPVFIIGSPRSGTTILAWSLAQHTQLWTSEESEFLFDLFGEGKANQAFQKALERPNPSWLRVQKVSRGAVLRAMGAGLNALYTSKSQGRRWIEQTPHYGLIADVLADMFPGALFLHIMRDGRQVVHSMVNVTNTYTLQDIEARKKTGHLPPWPSNFRSACVAWRWSVDACTAYCSKNPSRCLSVVNEKLSADPDKGFREIFEFLGVPYEDAVVNYFRSHRLNSSFPDQPSGAQPCPPKPRAWEDWTLKQRLIFVDEAGETMLRLGFTTERELNPFFAPSDDALVKRIREVVEKVLPADGAVAVLNQGDPELLNLHGRRAWHMPLAENGIDAGRDPVDSEEAVQHLDQLRAQGADYLLIPETSFRWLASHHGFRDHLERNFPCVWSDGPCRIYALLGERTGPPADALEATPKSRSTNT